MKTRIRILCASVVASALALGGALTGVPAFADETSWLQQALDEVPDRTSATIQVPPSKCGPEVQGPITLSGGKSVRLDLNGCDLTIIGNVALTIENGAKLELVGETPTVGLHVKSTGGNALLVDGNSVATVTSASAGAAGNNVDVRDGSKLTITGEVTGDNGILATDTGTQVTVGSIKVEKSPVQAYVGAKVTVDDDVTVTSPDDTTHISTSAGSVVNVGGRYLATSSGGSASASAVSGSTITLNESVSGHYVVFEADGFNSKVSTIGGTVTATQGVRAEATNSAIIQVNSPINAKDNVTVLAEESASVTLGGAVNVADGSLNLDTRPSETAIKGGEILLSKSAEASSDVQIKADRGPVTINGDVTGGGFPLITAYSTGITIVGNVTADGPVSLTAVDTDPSGNRPGSVLVKGKIAANDLNLTVDNASNIDVTGAVSVTNTVNAAVVNESKLRVGGALKASRIEAVAAIGGFADFIGAVTAEHAQLWACPWQTGPTSPNKPGTIMVRGDATFNDYSWIWACDGGEVRFFGALDSTVTDLTFGISDDEPWAFVGGSRSLTDPADTQEVIGETRYDVYQQSNGYPNGFDRILVRDMSYTPPLNRGTVSLSTTTPKVNDTLTVNTTKAFSPAATTLHYEWRADGAPIGKDAPSITVPASAVGKQIWVTVVGTRTGYVGDLVTTAKTSKVAKQTGPAKPAAPIAAATTSSAITLKATQGNEYSRNGTTWQASNTFTGLKPGAQYTFYQRVKETASRAPSATSTAAKIATAKAAGPAKPAVPVAASKTASAVTLKATAGHEYSRNGSTWQASNTFTGLQPGTQYTFYHRVKETSTTLASAHNSGKITTPLGTFASKGAVKITGTTKVGKTLTAKVTTPVSPSAGVTYSFQWLRGSTVVATSKASTKQTATYKLVARDKGKKITVKVTAIKAGYAKKTIQAVTAAIK